ncbi:MAG: sigma-70 family RNA polymerase sigma factor [Myxococcota bacterium]|nr:sigma-70 family RNA polymerase sigma factor [Myxococcota bacterium]
MAEDVMQGLGWAVARKSPELDLLSRAQAGDGCAYRSLVEPHLEALYRVAARMSGCPTLAEDAVQETLTLAYERLGDFRPEAPFRAYLMAIAVKRAKTLARSERRRLVRERKSAEPHTHASPEESLTGRRSAVVVRAALMAMPEKRRRAAVLRLDAGLSYREIAEVMGSSEGSARVLVHMALKELKTALTARGVQLRGPSC